MKIPVLLYVEEFKVRFNMLRTHILISSQNLKFENSPMQYTQFGEKKVSWATKYCIVQMTDK